MREQFRVDLRGLVDVLSHHLYSSERIYLRELVQNARDAIAARAALGHGVDGEVEIVPAWGTSPLIVRDNGVGLTADEMRSLLSMIGSSSKRGDLAATRRTFLGQFGIGLLAGFLVADSVEVVSRSARTPDAPTVRWVGSSDGTFTISDAFDPLPAPGTEVRLRPRHGAYRWCDTDACHRFAGEFAALLDIPVRIGETVVSRHTPPWKLSTEEQIAWCRDHFGFEAMGIIPLESSSADVTGLAFVLPYTARPGYRTGDRIYAQGMLVADTDHLIVPRWAFFCRAVIDAGDLPLTASREGLQESAALQFARARIGFQLLTELVVVHRRHPEVYRAIIRIHADGLKALAVHEPDVRDLLRTTLPYRTTHGPRTIQQLVDAPGPVPYVRDADTYLALGDVAAHAGVLLVDASGLHEADLLGLADGVEEGHFRDVSAREVVELARPQPLPEHLAAPLITQAERALHDEQVSVIVAMFEPADRPVLWWPPVAGSGEDAHGDGRGTVVLNAANPTVQGLLAAPAGADLRGPLRALYVTALLLGRVRPSAGQVALLRTAVLDMIDATRLGGRVSSEPDRVERRLRSL
jgi:molecular chaperone HtpG